MATKNIETNYCQNCGKDWDIAAATTFCDVCGAAHDMSNADAIREYQSGKTTSLRDFANMNNIELTAPVQPSIQSRIIHYVSQQYRVISQTENAAQLIKIKRFSVLWFMFWSLLAVVPGFWYVIYHVFAKRERQVYIYRDQNGMVQEISDMR